MDGLEKKLEEIHDAITHSDDPYNKPTAVHEIKQAFIDAGWIKFTATPGYDANAHRYDYTYVPKKAEGGIS